MKILPAKCSYIIYIIFSFLLISACGEGEQTENASEPAVESNSDPFLSFNNLMGASLNGEFDIV